MSSKSIISRARDTSDVKRTVLDNGLTVLIRESRTSPIVASMVWYGVGSRNEQKGETGYSHFLEHMLFKGTEHYGKGEIDLLTMKNGGSNNAFTSYDFTAYYFSFAADRWHAALDVEADRMVHTVFDPVEFESEKKVIIEELKAGLDQPWGVLMQEMNATAFQNHPYRNPVIGWLPDVEAATIDGIKGYYQKWYHPGNATVVLVGDFDSNQALEEVVARFGTIPSGSVLPEPNEAELRQEQERRFELSWRSDIPRLAIAYHTRQIGHRDSYPLQILAVILAEGKASRLYQRLVEREQTATFVSAEYGECRDETLFYIRSEGRGEVAPDDIEASIYDELERIANGNVTPHELDRAKHQIEAHFVFSMERALDQAMLFGKIETLQGLDYIESYLSNIEKVSVVAISDTCASYLVEHNRTVGRLVTDGPEASS